MPAAEQSAHGIPPLNRARRVHVRILVLALVAGAVCRARLVLLSDFPPGDGGLFYTITRDVQRYQFALPRHISYNSASIPFVHPPLPFYLAGALNTVAPGDLLAVLQFVPLAISTLMIVAFWLLSSSIMTSKVAAALSTLAFALLPEGIRWSIQVADLPRSVGILFGILAAREAYLLYTTSARRRIATTSAFLACAVLSHYEGAFLAGCALVLMYAAVGGKRSGLRRLAFVALCAGVATAPWWATIMARHGPSALLAEDQPGWAWSTAISDLLSLRLPGEPLFPLFGSLALLGALACLIRREFWLPAYLVVMLLGTPQALALATTVPLAMLSGIGVEWLLAFPWTWPFGHAASLATCPEHSDDTRRPQPPQGRLASVIVVAIMVYGVLSASVWQQLVMGSLPKQEREAMKWIAANTRQDSQFVVITPEPLWSAHRTLEWFPALAERVSVTTVQGTQWLGDDEYSRRIEEAQSLWEAAAEGTAGLEEWSRAWNAHFTHLYVVKPVGWEDREDCGLWRAFLRSLAADPRYSLVFDGSGAAIYARASTARPGLDAPWSDQPAAEYASGLVRDIVKCCGLTHLRWRPLGVAPPLLASDVLRREVELAHRP